MERSAGVYWFTGLSGSGKTTLSLTVGGRLRERGIETVVLDGDVLRKGLCADLGFSPEDRTENIRRAREVAGLLSAQGIICLCAFISPYEKMRDQLRRRLGGSFHLIFVDCPLATCQERDPKGYYGLARRGRILDYTAVGAPFEIPREPDFRVATDESTVTDCATRILRYILEEIHIG